MFQRSLKQHQESLCEAQGGGKNNRPFSCMVMGSVGKVLATSKDKEGAM